MTTTTAMYARELRAVGPLIVDASDRALAVRLSRSLASARAAGVARATGADGKIVGLPPATVDRLWAKGLADYALVEADGSRGLPLKAFASYEPEVPDASSIVVVVAGLDAVGSPLTAEHVHRADVLASTLGVSIGVEVTPHLLARALGEQVRRIRTRWPRLRLAVLLNKADGRDGEALGFAVARELTANAGDAGLPPANGRATPDAVVVASLRRGSFVRVPPAEA